MKPIIVYQSGDSKSSVWDDVKNIINNAYPYSQESPNFTYSSTWLGESRTKIVNFDRVSKRIILKQVDGDIIVTHPLLQNNNNLENIFSKKIDMKLIMNFLDENPDKFVSCVSYTNNDLNSIDLLKQMIFVSRTGDKVLEDGEFFNIETNENILNDIHGILWFVAYKIGKSSIYHIVFNNDLIHLDRSLEHETSDARHRFFDKHNNDLPIQILNPRAGKNVSIFDQRHWLVIGNSFTFDIGKYGFIYFSYGEELEPKSYKVHSDLILEPLENNKYRATFKNNQQVGYISIRMQSNSLHSMTFANSGQRTVLNIMIQKHFGV